MVRHAIVGAYLRAAVHEKHLPATAASGKLYARILIIRLDDIGDFVLTTPFLKAMRSGFPGSHISLLVNSSVASLARNCPYVDEVLQFQVVQHPAPFDQIIALLRARRFAIRQLAKKAFDCAIIPRADIDNACALAMAYYSGIPIRVGYSEGVLPLKSIKNSGYSRFLTHPVNSVVGRHEVEWALNVAEILGAKVDDRRLALWPSDTDMVPSVKELWGNGQEQKNWVAIAPGANLDRRRWPTSRFAELARELIRCRDIGIVIVGGGADVSLGRSIVSEAGTSTKEILDLTGRLTLGQTSLVLRRCQLFIGNDSGPMHIAAAMGVPCLEISCHPKDGEELASNSPARFSPWGVRHLVLQPERATSPCAASCVKSRAHCICQISVDQVIVAACRLMDDDPESSFYQN